MLALCVGVGWVVFGDIELLSARHSSIEPYL